LGEKLGGLTGWYVNHQGKEVDPNVAMQQVKHMYLLMAASGLSVCGADSVTCYIASHGIAKTRYGRMD
jgi:hypothetical protein